MAGEFDPLSSMLTVSLPLKAIRLAPSNQFGVLVSQLFAPPSPRHRRFFGADCDEIPMPTEFVMVKPPLLTVKTKPASPLNPVVGTKCAFVPLTRETTPLLAPLTVTCRPA